MSQQIGIPSSGDFDNTYNGGTQIGQPTIDSGISIDFNVPATGLSVPLSSSSGGNRNKTNIRSSLRIR
jgi:hypothetical protein